MIRVGNRDRPGIHGKVVPAGVGGRSIHYMSSLYMFAGVLMISMQGQGPRDSAAADVQGRSRILGGLVAIAIEA